MFGQTPPETPSCSKLPILIPLIQEHDHLHESLHSRLQARLWIDSKPRDARLRRGHLAVARSGR